MKRPEGSGTMGFSYDESGLPVMTAPQPTNGQSVGGPLSWPIDPMPTSKEPDDEIGDILVTVQKFAIESAEEAERAAQAVVESARAEAERIRDEARQQAAQHAQAVVESARAEADQIVHAARRQATQQAQTIVDDVRQHSVDMTASTRPGVSPDAVANLTASIAEFAETNRELIEELVLLRDSIAEPQAPRQPWEELQAPAPPRN